MWLRLLPSNVRLPAWVFAIRKPFCHEFISDGFIYVNARVTRAKRTVRVHQREREKVFIAEPLVVSFLNNYSINIYSASILLWESALLFLFLSFFLMIKLIKKTLAASTTVSRSWSTLYVLRVCVCKMKMTFVVLRLSLLLLLSRALSINILARAREL